jgi:hypothetical protein
MASLCMIVSCVGVDCPDKDECLLPHDVWAVKRRNHMSFYWLPLRSFLITTSQPNMYLYAVYDTVCPSVCLTRTFSQR